LGGGHVSASGAEVDRTGLWPDRARAADAAAGFVPVGRDSFVYGEENAMATGGTCCEFAQTCPWHWKPHWYSHRLETEFEDAYCYGGSCECAIRMVAAALGLGAVPDDMFPGERARAADIVGQAQRHLAKSGS
jgi:hypothetical protein